MSFIYDVKKLLDIGEDFEKKFVRKAQTVPDPDSVEETMRRNLPQQSPSPAPVDPRALALKLIQNLRHQLSPQAAKDANLYAKDLKNLRAFLDYAHEQKLGDVTGALLVMAGDTDGTSAALGKGAEFAALPEEDKKKYVQFTDGQVVYQVHKDGFVSYLKGLQQRASAEKNKIGEVMLGKIIDEANQKLKLGVDKNEQVLDMLPGLLQLDKNDVTRGTVVLKNTDLKDQDSVLKMLNANKVQYSSEGKANSFDANTVCNFLEWLLRRARASGNKAYVDAVIAVYNTCSVPGAQSNTQPQGSQSAQAEQSGASATGESDMATAVRRTLNGDPLDGNVLDLDKIHAFLTSVKHDLATNSAEFDRKFLSELGLTDSKSPVFQTKKSNIEQLITSALAWLQVVLANVNPHKIRPEHLRPQQGDDLRTFVSSVMKTSGVDSDKGIYSRTTNCLEALMKLVNLVYEIEDELIENPDYMNRQNQHKMGWLGLLQSVYSSARIAMHRELVQIRR